MKCSFPLRTSMFEFYLERSDLHGCECYNKTSFPWWRSRGFIICNTPTSSCSILHYFRPLQCPHSHILIPMDECNNGVFQYNLPNARKRFNNSNSIFPGNVVKSLNLLSTTLHIHVVIIVKYIPTNGSSIFTTLYDKMF